MRDGRLTNLMLRAFFSLRRRLAFMDALEGLWKKTMCTVGDDVRLYPASRIANCQRDKRVILIGAHCRIFGQLIVFAHGGSIRIGDSCFIGEDARIWSGESITIGDRVLISHGVNIHDNISHSLSAQSRYEHNRQIFLSGHPKVLRDVRSSPIVIGDDVWLGFNSTILKGVTIGKGAVVGASAVVTRDVEPFAIVVGNPARVVGQAEP